MPPPAAHALPLLLLPLLPRRASARRRVTVSGQSSGA
eukprot:gene1491-6679_t